VASNHEAIINVLTTEDRAEVVELRRNEITETDGLYWDQMFDYPHQILLVSKSQILRSNLKHVITYYQERAPPTQ
jgi:hypothetical protein